MARVLDTKLPGRGDAGQIEALVRNLAKKGDFKAGELAWRGRG